MGFQPDYHNLENCARNMEAPRLPLYEHIICTSVMEQILECRFGGFLDGGTFSDKQEFFRQYCRFFQEMGYDTVSFEQCIGSVMPGSGALGGHKEGVIKTREDFLNVIPGHQSQTDFLNDMRRTSSPWPL